MQQNRVWKTSIRECVWAGGQGQGRQPSKSVKFNSIPNRFYLSICKREQAQARWFVKLSSSTSGWRQKGHTTLKAPTQTSTLPSSSQSYYFDFDSIKAKWYGVNVAKTDWAAHKHTRTNMGTTIKPRTRNRVRTFQLNVPQLEQTEKSTTLC